jgi:hypothetical protein
MRALGITGEEREEPPETAARPVRLDPLSQNSAYDPETMTPRGGDTAVGAEPASNQAG